MCIFNFIKTGTSGVNLAVNCPSYQSTTWNKQYSSLAVDGSATPHQCSNTMATPDLDPWFVVDLGQEYTIGTVAIIRQCEFSFE